MKRALPVLSILCGLLLIGCSSLEEFHRISIYSGPEDVARIHPVHQPGLKTVFVIASNAGVEIFDLMAPYEIFASTGKLNVYVIAPEARPVTLWKGLFVFPHYSFAEMDMRADIKPDLIVVPNLFDPQNQQVIDWIKARTTSETLYLSICEGARVTAETGLFHGRTITSHSSVVGELRRRYGSMRWVEGQRYTKDGALFSTAGVSAATDGALAVVKELLGEQEVRRAMQRIRYPHDKIQRDFPGRKIGFGSKITIAGKVSKEPNMAIGILLDDGVSELEVAAILDAYNRSFPKSIGSIAMEKTAVISRHGLLLLPDHSNVPHVMDEVHVPSGLKISQDLESRMVERGVDLVHYDQVRSYIYDEIYQRLGRIHGKSFADTVMLLLDYPTP